MYLRKRIMAGLTALMMFMLMMVGTTSAQAGAITLEVSASSAPNAFGSPSWSTYASNALSSLSSGGGNVGDRSTDPTAYETIVNFTPGDVMVTSFNSWRGDANPTGAFAGEYGNRLHFGLAAIGDGTATFTLADVQFAITSSDGALDFSGDLAGTTLNGTTRLGLYYGADRALGGGDDVWYQSGESDTTVLDALFYVGVGNAYWPGGPGDPLTGQAALDYWSHYIGSNQISVTGTYMIGSDLGSTTLSVVPLPQAAPIGFALLGGLALTRFRRRRRR